jgi:hypothetical protein
LGGRPRAGLKSQFGSGGRLTAVWLRLSRDLPRLSAAALLECGDVLVAPAHVPAEADRGEVASAGQRVDELPWDAPSLAERVASRSFPLMPSPRASARAGSPRKAAGRPTRAAGVGGVDTASRSPGRSCSRSGSCRRLREIPHELHRGLCVHVRLWRAISCTMDVAGTWRDAHVCAVHMTVQVMPGHRFGSVLVAW